MIANLQAHYGFTVMPFTSAVPVEALYASAAHKEAVARLRWLISARGLGHPLDEFHLLHPWQVT